MRSGRFILLSSLFLLGVVLHAQPAKATYEAVAFTVDVFGSNADDLCCPGCSNTNWGDDHGQAFKDTMTNIGYTDVRWRKNKAVDPKDWVDSTKASWGMDHSTSGIDWADVAYLYTHGGNSCSTGAYYTRQIMGDYNNNECRPNTRDHYEWGGGNSSNRDLNIMLMEACHSGQRCVYLNGGFFAPQNGDLSLINGYHGIANHGSATRDDLIDYINASKYDGAGENWVVMRTDMSPAAGHHTCATSIGFGTSGADVDDAFDQGFKALVDPGTGFTSKMIKVSNCHAGGEANPL